MVLVYWMWFRPCCARMKGNRSDCDFSRSNQMPDTEQITEIASFLRTYFRVTIQYIQGPHGKFCIYIYIYIPWLQGGDSDTEAASEPLNGNGFDSTGS